ncbi:Zn-dependent exopeptidase M28 [Candidatus Thorarchaeota archaeon]|nr:MAG: Zn-dependent exopeptidase M28 [Candidatus Thorarchaeota archaeon]
MRKQVLTIIFLSLLVSSFGCTILPVQTNVVQVVSSSFLPAAEPLERVYGKDYSWDIWTAISQSSYTNYVRKVTENGSRWIQTPDLYSVHNGEARNWIGKELERVSNGRIEVETIGKYRSVVGRLPGYLPVEGPAFLVGGHFDSVAGVAGANDDGSGVAAMLEIARVMSEYEWPLDVYFGAWNAEEIGLFGSREVAREFNNRNIDLLVHYNVDMLLVPDSVERNVLMVYPIGPYNVGQYWADLTVQMSNTYGNGRIEPVMSTDFGAWQRSDHWSFIQEAYGSSLFAAESGGFTDVWYHQPGDVWNNEAYDYAVATEAVRAIGAAIAFTQARAFEMPVHGERSFTLLPGHEKNFYMAITGDTSINVSSRWYGGGATYSIFDPAGYLVEEVVFDNVSPWESSLVLEVPTSRQGVYHLSVYNHQGTSVGYEVSWMYDTDIDNNDIPDSEEFWFDVNLFSSDEDSDLLSDAYEMIIGTDWQSADSDQDLLPDKWELDYGLDPLDPTDALDDNDGDTLTNQEEFTYGSNPLLIDSDQDEIPDLWEVENGLNPALDDSAEDPDNDQVTNLEEYRAGTDPNVAEPKPLNYMLYPMILTIGVFALVSGSFFVYRKR